MKKVTLVVVVLMIYAMASDIAKTADSLYINRHLGLTNLQTALDMLENQVRTIPSDVQAWTVLSKVYFKQSDTDMAKASRLQWLKKGTEAAQRAISIDSTYADAHFWLAVNLGRAGQIKGVMNSLFMVPQIKNEINQTLKYDSDNTGAFDVKANIFLELPSFTGGNLDSAEYYFKRAIEIDPHYTLAKIDLARVYLKKKRKDLACQSFESVLNESAPAYPADYFLEDRIKAEKRKSEQCK